MSWIISGHFSIDFSLWFYQFPELTHNPGFLTAELINGCYWFLPKPQRSVSLSCVWLKKQSPMKKQRVFVYEWSQLFRKISSELCFAFFLSLLVDDSCADGSITQTEERKSAGFLNLRCLHHRWNETASPPQRLVQTHRGMLVARCCSPLINCCCWI